MRAVIGLSVDSESVAAVLGRPDQIEWRARFRRVRDVELRDTIRAVLAEFLGRRRLRPVVVASIWGAESGFRRLSGVPASVTSQLARSVVEAQPERFFCIDPSRTRLTPAVRLGVDWWCGHVDAGVITELTTACSSLGLGLRALLPGPALLTPAEILERDHDGALFSPESSFALAELTAFRAVESPFLIIHENVIAQRKRRALARNATITGILGLLASSLVVPGLIAARQRTHDETRLQLVSFDSLRLRRASDSANARAQEVIAVSRLLREHPSSLRTLSVVAAALPPHTVLLSLHQEGHEVTMVALTEDAPGLVENLEASDEAESVRVRGAISQESAGGRVLSRVAIGFQWAPQRLQEHQ